MLRFPRLSLVVTVLVVLYAAILTLLVSNGTTHDAWIGRVFPSLSDTVSFASHDHDEHALKHLEPTTVTVTKTHTQATTVIATTTVTAVQTVVPSIPGPAYCDECGEGDVLCKEYGRHNLERSRGFEGTNSRLKRVLKKAASGQPINIGVLGGSVTHGHGAVHPELWTDIFFSWWNTTFPHEENVFVNGAVPATGSEYFSVCALEHIDENVDLVILELSINDLRGEYFAMSYEWLVRHLLELPNKPAVVNANVFSVHFEYIATGGDFHLPVAQYYDLPVINLRHVLINHVLEHENLVHEFFHAKAPYPAEWGDDTRHMNRVGHKMMAELLVAYTQRQICQMAKDDVRPIAPYVSQDGFLPTLDTMEQVPRLRLFEHYVPDVRTPKIHSTCMTVRSKKHPLTPVHSTGWSEWAWKEKKYLLAREPGAQVVFNIEVGPLGTIKLDYLRSKTFGLGSVWCWVGEHREGGMRIDGYWEENLNIARNELLAQGHTPGPQSVTCEVLEETHDPSGGHEFRMLSLTSF